MINENMKPGTWWQARDGENMLIVADAAVYLPDAKFPIVATDKTGRYFDYRYDGMFLYANDDGTTDEAAVDLVAYLPDCTGFDDGVLAIEEINSTETNEVTP